MRWEYRVVGTPKPQPRSNTRVMFPAFIAFATIWRKSGSSLKTFYGKLRGAISAQVYVPAKHPVNEWKLLVKVATRQQRPQPVQSDGAMYRVELTFLFPRPKYMIWKTKPMLRGRKAGKRDDNDNLEKAVWDAITNAGFWADDGQVVENETKKFYASGYEKPGCLIVIETLNPESDKTLFPDKPEDDF